MPPKGGSLSSEARAHLSLVKKGKPLSGEHKKALELARKNSELYKARGPKISETIRMNIGRRSGGNHWAYGKRLSSEHIEKLKAARQGRVFSEETRRKLSESHRGEKGSGWKGGINPVNNTIRKSVDGRLWREAVFARYNWTCQKCGARGCNLNAHHIMNFAEYPGLRFAINNGTVLCRPCHMKFHDTYGRSKNTELQVKEYLSVEVKLCQVEQG